MEDRQTAKQQKQSLMGLAGHFMGPQDGPKYSYYPTLKLSWPIHQC